MLKKVKAKFSRTIKAVHNDPIKKEYPENLKKAIRKMAEKGISRYSIARELTINPTLVYKWCKQ